eukprot:TRINITY_DN4247_c0_g1_i1.p1 TRINITY_DN4247_c0_g1~~TRINITY_DN4247_c0_g1_i1.p1  ORF type:complete len:796 (+),score=193.83 TRINITY_DN4247_c0_g1_i1:29-2416(+)
MAEARYVVFGPAEPTGLVTSTGAVLDFGKERVLLHVEDDGAELEDGGGGGGAASPRPTSLKKLGGEVYPFAISRVARGWKGQDKAGRQASPARRKPHDFREALVYRQYLELLIMAQTSRAVVLWAFAAAPRLSALPGRDDLARRVGLFFPPVRRQKLYVYPVINPMALAGSSPRGPASPRGAAAAPAVYHFDSEEAWRQCRGLAPQDDAPSQAGSPVRRWNGYYESQSPHDGAPPPAPRLDNDDDEDDDTTSSSSWPTSSSGSPPCHYAPDAAPVVSSDASASPASDACGYAAAPPVLSFSRVKEAAHSAADKGSPPRPRAAGGAVGRVPPVRGTRSPRTQTASAARSPRPRQASRSPRSPLVRRDDTDRSMPPPPVPLRQTSRSPHPAGSAVNSPMSRSGRSRGDWEGALLLSSRSPRPAWPRTDGDTMPPPPPQAGARQPSRSQAQGSAANSPMARSFHSRPDGGGAVPPLSRPCSPLDDEGSVLLLPHTHALPATPHSPTELCVAWDAALGSPCSAPSEPDPSPSPPRRRIGSASAGVAAARGASCSPSIALALAVPRTRSPKMRPAARPAAASPMRMARSPLGAAARGAGRGRLLAARTLVFDAGDAASPPRARAGAGVAKPGGAAPPARRKPQAAPRGASPAPVLSTARPRKPLVRGGALPPQAYYVTAADIEQQQQQQQPLPDRDTSHVVDAPPTAGRGGHLCKSPRRRPTVAATSAAAPAKSPRRTAMKPSVKSAAPPADPGRSPLRFRHPAPAPQGASRTPRSASAQPGPGDARRRARRDRDNMWRL